MACPLPLLRRPPSPFLAHVSVRPKLRVLPSQICNLLFDIPLSYPCVCPPACLPSLPLARQVNLAGVVEDAYSQGRSNKVLTRQMMASSESRPRSICLGLTACCYVCYITVCIIYIKCLRSEPMVLSSHVLLGLCLGILRVPPTVFALLLRMLGCEAPHTAPCWKHQPSTPGHPAP